MDAQFQNICFIVNPGAGTWHTDMGAMIRRLLRGTGRAFDVCGSEYPGHGAVLSREAADAGVDLVVAVGGDGTINEVGKGLLGRETPLGIVPVGSGNALASALGIPLHPVRACRGLLQARLRAIDVGKVGEAIFFSTAGIGLDAAVCHEFNRRSGGRRGFLTYAVLTLAAWRSYRPEEVRVKLDGVDFRVRPTVLTVANSCQFGNRVKIAPQARPDDGLLDLCILEDIEIARALWHGRRLFTGSIHKMPGVRLFQAQKLWIERDAPGRLQLDGESTTGGAVLAVSLMPHAIRIAVPVDGRAHGSIR